MVAAVCQLAQVWPDDATAFSFARCRVCARTEADRQRHNRIMMDTHQPQHLIYWTEAGNLCSPCAAECPVCPECDDHIRDRRRCERCGGIGRVREDGRAMDDLAGGQ